MRADRLRSQRWLLAFVSSLLASCAHADADRSLLDGFPQTRLAIVTPDARVHPLTVWVADTPSRRAQGLMWVRDLPDDTGMLFVYGHAQPVSMWMKNTLIPLDMLFVRADGRIVRIVEDTEPLSLETITSPGDVLAVIELEGGDAARRGVRVGAIVQHPVFGNAPAARP